MLETMLAGKRPVLSLGPPGPAILTKGNLDEGYYGSLGLDEFISTADLAAQNPAFLKFNPVKWYKFSYRGKILYISRGYLAGSWYKLYEQGLIYGTDDHGLFPTAKPTNQKTVVTHPATGSRFLVRVMRLTDGVWANGMTPGAELTLFRKINPVNYYGTGAWGTEGFWITGWTRETNTVSPETAVVVKEGGEYSYNNYKANTGSALMVFEYIP